MSIETAEELEGLRRAGRAVAITLREVRARARPGVTTGELDRFAERTFQRLGARPAPRLLLGFPGAICISVNDEAVHGIPGRQRLRAGDLVKLDVTAEVDGFYADAAISVPVGPPAPLVRRLCAAADAALARALEAARPGARLNEIGLAVEREVGSRGFAVLHELCGHGVGRTMHEDPSVPNVYVETLDQPLTEGLVLAVEPVISAGSGEVRQVGRWVEATADGSLAAHAEHTIAIRAGRPLVLTAA